VRVVLLGAGGHARVVLDALQRAGESSVVGCLDPDPALRDRAIGSTRVIGDDSMLPRLRDQGVSHAIVAVGSVDARGNDLRKRLYSLVHANTFAALTVVHPTAVIADSARVAAGTVVLATAVVNAYATVGENVIINTAAVIEHDCAVGDHCHIAPQACLGGGVVMGEGAFIGLGARVLPGVRIGPGAVVAAGAVVLHDVTGGETVMGIPARSRAPR